MQCTQNGQQISGVWCNDDLTKLMKKTLEPNCTIGSFARALKHISDCTVFAQFIKNKIGPHQSNIPYNQIIIAYGQKVDAITSNRNDVSHGGKVISINDAKNKKTKSIH